ncbi:MAG TPA: hypothetical protein PLD47_06170 [Aggregatilineales bacterium]|nr:hypothetical protein [Anaerolineales bacterium]HRE47295.1 hypothetical protein [Aggregatilineales bacterium]
MGRLLTIHPCPVCNYHIEDVLHEGGSGIDTSLLRNHYVLGVCQTCHEVVSLLIPNTAEETLDALKTARYALTQMEADAVIGDLQARDMLPFFRQALDTFDENVPLAETSCTNCGSTAVRVLILEGTGLAGKSDETWITCPRCDEGRLFVEVTGRWD